MKTKILSVLAIGCFAAVLLWTAQGAENGPGTGMGGVMEARAAEPYLLMSGETEGLTVSGGNGAADMPEDAVLEGNVKENTVSAGAAAVIDGLMDGEILPEDSGTAIDGEAEKDAAQESEAGNGSDEEAGNEYANFAIADVDHYVNVRSTPDTGGEIVGKMYDGAVAQILAAAGERNEWFQIVSGRVEGYIKSEYFIYGDAAADVMDDYVTHYAQVLADRLNIRKEPAVASAKIGYIDKGEKLKVLEDLGEWLRVAYTDAKEGYVAAEYVLVKEEFTYAKSLEEERAMLAAQREMELRQQEQDRAEEAGSGGNAEGEDNGSGKPVSDNGGQEAASTENSNADTSNTDSGGDTPVPDTGYTTNEELRQAIVEYAMQYQGNQYVHGGGTLSGGTDCSGFTSLIYADFGYSISRTPSGQYGSSGRSISYEEIQPGDIICYTPNGKKCTHVGLYIGNGQIIHSANKRKGVIVSAADYDTILAVKNVID